MLDENLNPVFFRESVIKIDCRYDFNDNVNSPSTIEAEEECIFKLSKGSELKTLDTVSGIIFKGSMRTENDSKESFEPYRVRFADRITEY